MTNQELDNLISRINKDVEQMNYEIELFNTAHTGEYNNQKYKTNVFKWLVVMSLFLIAIGSFITSRYVGVYVWYVAYIPLFLTGGTFLTFFIFYLINNGKKNKIKKNWDNDLKHSNDLAILITRHSKIVRDEILERLGETKEEVVRVIGNSLPDLIEYYEYYKDFVSKNPGVKPEVKRIKPLQYDFEKVSQIKDFSDDEIIEKLSFELKNTNYSEIIHIVKNGILKGHTKIYGYIYSFALENFKSKDRNNLYNELIDSESKKNINAINYFSFLFDYSYYNKRNYKTYLSHMNKDSIYYDLINIIYRNKLYNRYVYNNLNPIDYYINAFNKNEIILNNYEINELLRFLFSIGLYCDISLSKKLYEKYNELYNKHKNVLRKDTYSLYLKQMILYKLKENNDKEVDRLLFELRNINKNDLYLQLLEILFKYKVSNFKTLFKKYHYNDLTEFKELEKKIMESKDYNLSNELYSFKRAYYL